MDPKSEATAAIERAQTDLQEALVQLRQLPAVDNDQLKYTAHALSNYLMVVSTTEHLLRKASPEDPHVQERLDALKQVTQLMKQLVGQLLVPQQGEPPNLIFSAFDLNTIVAWACNEYEPLALAKTLSLKREFSGDPVMVRIDRVAVGAVLDNLLSNAVKYSRPGGSITVRVSRTPSEGICAITDAGPGISEADRPRLFIRGGTLSTRPTAGERSLGYGLAIAKDLMNALHGRIWFENERSGGATFSFSLPLEEAGAETFK